MLTMVSQLDKREFFGLPGTRGSMVDEDRLIQRLGHSKTLQGHGGCVNTLRWNLSGSILASGSDDQKVKIWRLDGSLLLTIPTGHRANVFAVEFLPVGNDQIIISAAGDHFVKMHNIETKDEPFTWSTNARVKRLATAQDDPFLFWSAAEDGYVREYDARSNEDRKLIETSASRVKSFAICQGRTEMVAVATDHSEVPIYDRRKPDVPLITCQNADDLCHDHFTYSTHVSFDHYGTECLVNQGCGPVYLFKLKNQGEPTVLEKLRDVISEKCESSNGKHSATFIEARERAKELITTKRFPEAIDVYNHALSLNPGPYDRSVLLANRAMGYLCRRWEGDSYACVRDCIEALLLYSGNSKALWRLARSLMLLEQWSLAEQCIDLFKRRFPDDTSVTRLENQVTVATDSSHIHNSHVLIDEEKKIDYSERYSGHTNTHTDIKEANFFGSKNQYIVAGSDCGSLLLWERSTGILKAAWRADDNILNIVQPHPEKFLLATSGIEDVIRFWEPLAEDAMNERRVEDVWGHFGQRRRNPSEAEQFFRVMGARMMSINRTERPECITS